MTGNHPIRDSFAKLAMCQKRGGSQRPDCGHLIAHLRKRLEWGTILRQPTGRIESKRFIGSVRSTVTNTFRFSGRSPRSEFIFYWVAAAAVGMIPFILLVVISQGGSIGRSVLILSAILLIPFPALLVRRLHDQNRSGWWAVAWAPAVLTGIIKGGEPIGIALGSLVGLGNLLVLAFLLWPGSIGANRFGSNPRADANGS